MGTYPLLWVLTLSHGLWHSPMGTDLLPWDLILPRGNQPCSMGINPLPWALTLSRGQDPQRGPAVAGHGRGTSAPWRAAPCSPRAPGTWGLCCRGSLPGIPSHSRRCPWLSPMAFLSLVPTNDSMETGSSPLSIQSTELSCNLVFFSHHEEFWISHEIPAKKK